MVCVGSKGPAPLKRVGQGLGSSSGRRGHASQSSWPSIPDSPAQHYSRGVHRPLGSLRHSPGSTRSKYVCNAIMAFFCLFHCVVICTNELSPWWTNCWHHRNQSNGTRSNYFYVFLTKRLLFLKPLLLLNLLYDAVEITSFIKAQPSAHVSLTFCETEKQCCSAACGTTILLSSRSTCESELWAELVTPSGGATSIWENN